MSQDTQNTLDHEVAAYLSLRAAEEEARKARDSKAKSISASLPASGHAQAFVDGRQYSVSRFGDSITVRRGKKLADASSHVAGRIGHDGAGKSQGHTKQLDRMNKDELMAVAERNGVEYDPEWTKAQIVDAINAAGGAGKSQDDNRNASP